MKQVIWIILLFTFHSVEAFAQSNIETINSDYLEHIQIIDDELWVSNITEGINRYSGIKTNHYLLNDSINRLKGSSIQSKCFKDFQHNLWISSYEYLCFFLPPDNTFDCNQIQYNENTITSGYHIYDIDSDLKTLYLKAGSTLIDWDIKSNSITEVIGQTLGNKFLRSENRIIASPWLNSSGFELWNQLNNIWTKEHITFTNCKADLNHLQVRSSVIHKNEIWLISNVGLVKYAPANQCNSKLFQFEGKSISLIDAISWHDKLFIITEKSGLLVFDLTKEEFINHIKNTNTYRPLISNSPDALYIDPYNILWLSDYSKGLKKIPIAQIFSVNRKALDNHIWSRIESYTDALIYTDLVSEVNIETHNGKIVVKLDDLNLVKLVDIELWKNHLILIDQFKILIIDIKSNNIIKKIENIENQISDALICKDSIYATIGLNLYKTSLNNPQSWIKLNRKLEKDLEIINYVSNKSLSINANSKLWIKNQSIDTVIDIKCYINKSAIDYVTGFHFCATNSGLYEIDSDYQVSKIANEPWQIGNRSITDIKHHQGYVYMVIEKRIARYNPGTKKLIYFTKDHFEHSPVFAIQDSVIHIAEKYVMSYDLNEAFTDTNEYILKLDELKINREALNLYETDVSSGLDLDHTQNEIAFTHYTNNWHNSDLSSLRYKLLPHYPEWTMIKNGEEVEFPFLPPDKYTYMIQGILPSGEMTEVTSFPFEVNPPWWKTNWFYALSGIGIISILYSLYRYRLSQLTESLRIDNEMSQLEKSALQAQMNPHFIFNCLNSIQGFIMDNDKEQAMEYLGKFAKLIRLNLNASVDSFIRLDQEILILENYLALEQLRHDYSFTYHISSTSQVTIDTIDIPPMLIQPFVENAVLHGMKDKNTDGKIEINFAIEKEMLVIDIKDNGAGPSIAKKSIMHRSLGMSITKKRLEHINRSESDQYAIEQIPTKEGSHHRVRIKI